MDYQPDWLNAHFAGRCTMLLRCLGCVLSLVLASAASATETTRVLGQLEALYDFEERAGSVIHDRSQADPPLQLQIETPGATRWKDGALFINGPAMIASAGPAKKILAAIKRSSALTIEVWAKPANESQTGPARIISLSADPGQRNLTLGQEGQRYDVRVRTASTDNNGLPSLSSPDASLKTELTHVVYSRHADGQATIYINGKPQATRQVSGNLANWSDEFRLLLANERTGDRAWQGELHLLAIYSRALTESDVGQNLAAGPQAKAFDYAALLPPPSHQQVDFVKDIQPILREHCFECHSQENEEGGLNLGVRSRTLEGGEHGPVLVPGDSAASRLIHLVAGLERDALMPPKENDPLAKEQIGMLRAWIDQGAPWPREADVPDPRLSRARTHWAFQPLRPVELPSVQDASWPQTPIDRFILAALEAKGLFPTPPAELHSLIRRLTFDVTGLPPDPAEVQSLQGSGASDRSLAVAPIIDRLLANPRHGERWARHWLDVARYADSDGYESDADRPQASHFRDFVIRAMNEDLPGDTFLRWQLAGDEIQPDLPQAWAATGFITGAANTILPPTHLEEERLRNRYNELDDMLSTIGTGMLGLTVGCARCHDHKYDAISAREYYRLLSALHSGDRQVAKVGPDAVETLVFRDVSGEPRSTWLFGRGDFYDRDQPVALGFLEVLSQERTAEYYLEKVRSHSQRGDTTYQRAALAAWLTDVEQGAGALAARVIVNRVWQHHFGEGLVRTVSDFGVRSQPPSHPELLEWLAHDLVAHGWQFKRLHRLILSSAVYQQSSQFDPEKARIDPENRLLWCKPPMRLEAEILRDAMLAVSGTLNLQAYGPAFKPPIAADAMVARNTKSPYPADARDDAQSSRRSIYMFHKRVVPYPLLQAFDRPDAQQSCGRRDQTTVAPQALALLNDPFVRARAADFAARLVGEGGGDEQLVARALQLALARESTEVERAASLEFLTKQLERRRARAADKSAAEIRLAAVADYCQTLFGLNEFIYID